MLGMKRYSKEYIDACRARVDADLRAYRKQVGKEPALGVVCRLAGCGPVQPNRRGTAKDQVHSDEKAEDHVTLTHHTREKEHCPINNPKPASSETSQFFNGRLRNATTIWETPLTASA